VAISAWDETLQVFVKHQDSNGGYMRFYR
jgi:hypothetical protein